MAREYSCSQCEFMIRSENDDELIEFVREHAEDTHDMSVSEEDVRSGWKMV